MSTDLAPVTERARALLAPLGESEARRAIHAALDHVGRASSPHVRSYGLLLQKAPDSGDLPLRRISVLVGEERSDTVHEAQYFAGKLVESQLAVAAVVVNRLQPRFGDTTATEAAGHEAGPNPAVCYLADDGSFARNERRRRVPRPGRRPRPRRSRRPVPRSSP